MYQNYKKSSLNLSSGVKKTLSSLLCAALISFSYATLPDTAVAQERNCILGFCLQEGTVGSNPEDFGRYPEGTDFISDSRADLDTVPNIIISLSYFLNNVLIPFLFAVALLLFLVNAARYFIIGGASEENRKKARNLAVYGIAAFVFLVSLWGIVNTVVSGLGIDSEESLCPDYLNGWCGNRGYTDPRAGLNLGGNGNSGDTGSGIGSSSSLVDGTTGNGTSIDELPSAIAELVFGDLTDTAGISFIPGDPRALGNTITIANGAACTSALTALALASDVETNQAAYLLYEQNNMLEWRNVTDTTSMQSVSYDGDTITNLMNNGATNLHLVHTHQKQNTEEAGLISLGYGPSASDMHRLCDTALLDVEHIVVDWNNVWRISQPTGTCPRRSDQTDNFPVIEAVYLLAETDPASRQQEYEDLINADFVPNQYETIFRSWQNQDFANMTSGEIRGLVAGLLGESDLTIEKLSHAGFCSSL